MSLNFAIKGRSAARVAIILLAAISASVEAFAAETEPPERVSFPSADGKTSLIGYVFEPADEGGGPHPAVVLMHGRGGAYSISANGVYSAATLSARHQAWGHEWAAQGYVAVLVDSFGPRGYVQGFPRHSYDQRPAELDEVTIRPLDAYGALAYLRSRPDVAPEKIGLMGWSNGASAALAAMTWDASGLKWPNAKPAFRAALAFYPGCRLKGQFDERPLRPYAPVLILHGTDDEEVSSEHCVELAQRSRSAGGNVEIELFEGATHGFNSPTPNRQALEANRIAITEATERALEFFDRHVKGQLAAGQDD